MFQKSSICFFLFFFGLGHTEIHTKVKVSMDNMLESELFGLPRAGLNKNMQSNVLGERVSKICRF